jgi:glutathionylspermidine synthase
MKNMLISNQQGLTYDVNGIITDGIRKYDKHVWKCYHWQQQMELNDRNWYECKFCHALQQRFTKSTDPTLN